MGNQGPIFVHSSFRVGSTWLWGKFRAQRDYLAYCEYFNEALATINTSTTLSLHDSSWDSNHPPHGPYYLEYTPLMLPTGGVNQYSPDMAFEKFIPSTGVEGDISQEEIDYITLLIDHAKHLGRIPVLTCTRSLGRSKSLKKQFGGTHILLTRNPFHQWASYSKFALKNGGDYFISTTDLILKNSKKDQFLSRLDEITSKRSLCRTDENAFIAFVITHLHLYAIASQIADYQIDVTQVSENQEKCRDAQRELLRLTGLNEPLDDARPSFQICDLKIRSISALAETITSLSDPILRKLDQDTASLVQSLRDATLSELQRHEFYTRGAKNVAASIQAKLNAADENVATLINRITTDQQTISGLQNALDTQANENQQRTKYLNTILQENIALHCEADRATLLLAAATDHREIESREITRLREQLCQAEIQRSQLLSRIASRDTPLHQRAIDALMGKARTSVREFMKYNADDPQLRSAHAMLSDGVKELIAPNPGHILYGPYCSLNAGHYLALLSFSEKPVGIGIMEVTYSFGKTRLGTSAIKGPLCWITIRTPQKIDAVEVRIFASQKGFQAKLKQLEIFRICNEPRTHQTLSPTNLS